MRTETCLAEDTLAQYVRGAIGEVEVVELEKHLAQCAGCRERVQALRAADVPGQAPITGRGGAGGLTETGVAAESQTILPAPAADGLRDTTCAASDASKSDRPSDRDNSSLTFLAAPETADELGRLGSYRVLKVLGKGGMGMVFHAEDLHLQRPVALKVMLPSMAADPLAKERFLREARAAAAIRHDHVRHHLPGGRGWARRLPGHGSFSKANPCTIASAARNPLPTAEVLRVGREIAEGLAAAHETRPDSSRHQARQHLAGKSGKWSVVSGQ